MGMCKDNFINDIGKGIAEKFHLNSVALYQPSYFTLAPSLKSMYLPRGKFQK